LFLIKYFTSSNRDSDQGLGIVYGLVVVMGQGKGRILSIGTILLPGGNRRLKLTGSLELVEKRIKGPLRVFINGRHTREEGKKKGNHGIESDLDTNRGQGLSVHLHLPARVQKNNRPSASIAMVCVLVSLLTGSCIPTNIAMTYEVGVYLYLLPHLNTTGWI